MYYRPQIFLVMNSVRSNSLSLKYKRFILSGCKDIKIRKFDIEIKLEFLFLGYPVVVVPSMDN